MATDFFQRQDAARHRTTTLLVYFGLALCSLVTLAYLLCAVLFASQADEKTPIHLWDPTLFAAVAAGVTTLIGGASLFKIAQFASGGKAVALMLNGQEVPGDTTDPTLRRLMNVVEEMAIASGIPAPAVFVLPEEAGINAFAAGHAPGDAVVAVSRGCLTYLTRDELQGVVAHEFSHILNGDMRLNLRVTGIIFGIMVLSYTGWIIMRTAPTRSSSSNNQNNGQGIALLGLGLYILGLAGAFFGWLIQAAISRQREYLADASAVQFTRNPEGLGGALKKIGGLEPGSKIGDGHASEISHMFQADPFGSLRPTNLFATHPPLGERIRRLEPNFDGKFPSVQPLAPPAEVEPTPSSPRRAPGMEKFIPLVLGASSDTASSHVGLVESVHVDYAATLFPGIPEVLRTAAQSSFSARAVIYGLLLDPQPAIREAQLARLRAEAEPRDLEETLRLAEAIRVLPDEARIPLVDLTLPALRQTCPAQRRTFRAQVDSLIRADEKLSLFEYALSCVLNRYLGSGPDAPPSLLGSAAPAKDPITVVLSRLAWEGHDDDAVVQNAYAAGMRVFRPEQSNVSPLVPRDKCGLGAFDAAVRMIAKGSSDVKRRAVDACAACILFDGQVTVRERELLRAVSATFGCPLPPLIASQTSAQ